MMLPCVTTSIANASLYAEDGRQVLVGDTAQAFADHLVALLRNPERRDQLAIEGYNYVNDNFSWEKAGEKLEAVLQSVVNKKVKGKN